MAETSERHALYRIFGEADRLLYIGYSNDPARRLAEHAAAKTWWHEVARWEVEWLASEELAAAAETIAIALEHPQYNIHKQAMPMRHPDFSAPASDGGDRDFEAAIENVVGAIRAAALLVTSASDSTRACFRAGRLVDYAAELQGATGALRTATVASLRTTEGLTLQEIADLLGIRLPTVQKVLEREKRAARQRASRQRPADKPPTGT